MADGQHALAGLKVGQRLNGLLGAVAEVLAHGPVEVDVHQTRQGIQALGVDHLFARFRGGKGHDAPVADEQRTALKGVARRINQCILNDHAKHLVLLSGRLPAGKPHPFDLSITRSFLEEKRFV